MRCRCTSRGGGGRRGDRCGDRTSRNGAHDEQPMRADRRGHPRRCGGTTRTLSRRTAARTGRRTRRTTGQLVERGLVVGEHGDHADRRSRAPRGRVGSPAVTVAATTKPIAATISARCGRVRIAKPNTSSAGEPAVALRSQHAERDARAWLARGSRTSMRRSTSAPVARPNASRPTIAVRPVAEQLQEDDRQHAGGRRGREHRREGRGPDRRHRERHGPEPSWFSPCIVMMVQSSCGAIAYASPRRALRRAGTGSRRPPAISRTRPMLPCCSSVASAPCSDAITVSRLPMYHPDGVRHRVDVVRQRPAGGERVDGDQCEARPARTPGIGRERHATMHPASAYGVPRDGCAGPSLHSVTVAPPVSC